MNIEFPSRGVFMLRSQHFKKLSAIAGGSAFAAMVLVSLAVTQNHVDAGTSSSAAGATLGQTVKPTTPPAEPVTSKATPPFTFTTPSQFAVPH
jgi:hypothetical protein